MNNHLKKLVIIGVFIPNLLACKGEVHSKSVSDELTYKLHFQEIKDEHIELMHYNREIERHNYALNRQAKELALEEQTKEEETTESETYLSQSAYYNKFVTTNEVTSDWTSAEHISEVAVYSYVLAFNYNATCIPGKGSAFFVHVSSGRPTAGCISVSEENMLTIIRNVAPGCKILIDNKENIGGY